MYGALIIGTEFKSLGFRISGHTNYSILLVGRIISKTLCIFLAFSNASLAVAPLKYKGPRFNNLQTEAAPLKHQCQATC